ncbi:Transposase, partial [Bifidobacterium longum subsp. longum]
MPAARLRLPVAGRVAQVRRHLGLQAAFQGDPRELAQQAEMTSHLGYAPGDRESKAGGGHANSRNGSYPKTSPTGVDSVLGYEPLREFACPRPATGSRRRAAGMR